MKKIIITTIIFVILLIAQFGFMEEYITNAETKYTNSIKKEIQTDINNKLNFTDEFSLIFAENPEIIKIFKQKKYNEFYKKGLFVINDDLKYKNIWIHIVDNNGIARYLSWSKKTLNKNVLSVRKDLAYLIKHPKPFKTISSGKFGLTFKSIRPIYDKSHKFLGLIEVITHFNSISKSLQKQNIYSAVVLNKKLSKNIKHPFTKTFVDGHYIANLDINNEIKYYLHKYTIEKLSKIKTYKEIDDKNHFLETYFVVNIPIKDFQNKTIAHYLAFIKDDKLKFYETLLNIGGTLIFILFLYMSYLAYNLYKENLDLISNLKQKIKKEIDEKLKLIYTDSLTGTYKKIKFEEDRDNYQDYFVIMINIKKFSKINEMYGFKIGDKILQIVTKRIENIINSKLYRINGDEFVFFTKYPKIHKKISEEFVNDPIKIDNSTFRISFYFGGAKNQNELLRKLSIAMKEAKNSPYKKIVFYKERNQKTDTFLKFNNLLYQALSNNKDIQLVPFLQGIHNNKTGKIEKYESLVRLKADKIYSPYFFLNVAKHSGMLTDITKIMIDKSFKIAKEKNIKVSINITEDDLLTNKLKSILTTHLEKYQLEANQITLEILEGITSNGTKSHIRQLKELKKLGFLLAIDDFGVEYSNFERLTELDVDFIKIDGKYIKVLNTDMKSYIIARTITDFAHSLGAKVVAEFVDNKEVQQIVEELGIDYTQGYYFSEPKEME